MKFVSNIGFSVLIVVLPAVSQVIDKMRPGEWALESNISTQWNPISNFAPIPQLNPQSDFFYETGTKCIWTGLALASLGLLAYIPVAYDGAFGITAADAGIGNAFLGVGAALVHLGIPLMGAGVNREEKLARSLRSGFEGEPSGWTTYKQSWMLIGAGCGLIIASAPFLLFAEIDIAQGGLKRRHVIAQTVFYGGAALGGVGILGQYYSGYRFFRAHEKAQRSMLEPVSLSIQPVLRLGQRGQETAGLRLNACF